jgi:hypothetical protein
MPGYTITPQRVPIIKENYKQNIIMAKSNHSYTTNRKIIEKFNSNSWLGKRCFIIGGGESLKGFDFNRLDNELTIGINKVFKFYPNSTINYSMDSTLYNQIRQGDLDRPGEPKLSVFWDNYKGTRVFLTPMERKQFGQDVYLVRRELHLAVNIGDLDKGIFGGNNSGTGAITLAIALGAQNIFLLGYDMKAVNQTHFHEGYEKRDLKEFNKKLNEYRDDITKICPLLRTVGVNVVNLNPNSDLKCFPFAKFDDVIKE